ncbi:EthD domain-containing protein [Xylariales sp. PMI_506]|nr:EthD domain-containing protein [Xylariales sp. PMI_506]
MAQLPEVYRRSDGVVCSVAFLKKNPNITHEQFYHHWENIHGPLVKPWAQKHGIISYTQVHTTQAFKVDAKPLGPEATGESPLIEYDGCAVLEAESFDVFTNAFQDEYYQTVISEDEMKFIDKKAGVLRARGESKKII